MNVWAIKARWIKACVVSNKRYGVTITKLSVYCFMLAIRLWLHLIELCLLHNIAENIAKKYRKKVKNEKRCRDGAPKSTQTREDLNIQSPIPYIFTVLRKDIQMDEALSTYLNF